MVVMPSLSKFTPKAFAASLCRSLIIVLAGYLCSCPTFARSKNRTGTYQASAQIQQLDAVLKSNDVESAQVMAATIYQQATNAPALQSPDPTVIIDPVLAAQTAELNRSTTAYQIAATFYKYADLDDAKLWATTVTTGGSPSGEYVRRATVLLGNIASAMDNGDEAITDFQKVIVLPGQYREQVSAYAGLLETLMLQKQDDLVVQWVQQGQAQFAGGDLELDFLKQASVALKRRNHPLWRELDQQIVAMSSSSAGSKLMALRALASNARKFGRWSEAETNYAAICAMELGSTEETVNSYLFLAECQAKQGKDFGATISTLAAKSAMFTKSEDRDYATYRIAKFQAQQDKLDAAAAGYLQASSASSNTWAAAAFHQLGLVKEKQGDIKGALQLYLQYPQQFPQNKQLVLQSYGSALNAATMLGDTNATGRIVDAITNNAAAIEDYNTQLNLAFFFKKVSDQKLAQSFLEGGLRLAQQTLKATADVHQRSLIHFHAMRRLFDFAQYQRIVDYFTANAGDMANADTTPDNYQLQCQVFKAMALIYTGQRQQGMDELRELFDQVQANPDLGPDFAGVLGCFYNAAHDNAAATELFEWAARKYPDHEWASFGRLKLAIQEFNAGDYAAAQKLTEEITNVARENSRLQWLQRMYWETVYVRGCCLQAQGHADEGASLKQLAKSRYPGLQIQDRLHSPEQ